ncbi:oligosaccharide flippase family protein [Mucilaginibacter sp. BJC16-A38]|uniref:oligosaccharide flippase family protein n=1 Tax=Mucilaginibacter phenanthrenivorans TaxID=1234842 RepID=UPI002157ED2D|nr:polysaccharide biosynthesis C-terminal domain-containing protein [Mucilaginibacter phenanthrenivorans]MCR8558460.1 oligosaccharide flippase family protein [Mucilaginibacter phenanthrenivorans]
MSIAKKFAGQTAIYGVSTIASRVLSFFLTPIYTRAYASGAYGVLTTMFSWASILNAVMAFGMETTFFRYLNKYSDNKQRVYNNAFASVAVITVLFLLFTLPFISSISSFIEIGRHAQHADFTTYVEYFMAILIIDAWCVIPFAKIRADGRPGRYGVIKFINVIIFITLNLSFIWFIPFWLNHHLVGSAWISTWYVKGWIGYVFLSNLFSSIITFLLLLPEFLKVRFDFDRKMLVEMFSYSWPVLIANLSFIINENLDKLLLGKLLPLDISDHDVGIYGACAKISLFLSIFIQAFRLGAEPFFFSHAKNKNSGHTYARIMDYFVITVCLIFVALVANIDILKYFIKGHDAKQTAVYWTGLGVIPPLVFGYVSLGIYMNLSVWYKLSDQTKYGLYISGIGAILTIVLNVLFIPKYSYMASAWISLIAYATMMVLSYVWGQKNYPIPYNLKKNLAYIIASIIIVYLSFYLFKRNIFAGNLLLLIFGLTAIYLEWKNLKAIFKR